MWDNYTIYYCSLDFTGIPTATWEEIRGSYRLWLDLITGRKLEPHLIEPNALSILARAVNAVRLRCGCIFQPRWKAGRFKAKT